MTCKPSRRTLLTALLLGVAFGASADPTYPNRAVKFVVAFAAGGPIDLATRVMAEQLSSRLGQPFMVENRTGANGAIAAEFVRTAPPDGYTLLVTNASMVTITPTLKKDLKYNFDRDFTPVSRIAASGLVLVVNPENPVTRNVKSVADLIAVAKRAPQELAYGSAGLNGNVQQLAFELFAGQAGVKFLSTPYKGASEAQSALLAQTVELGFDTLTAIPLIKAGKLTPLAVSSKERMRELPDVPTMQELGYPGFDISFWSGVFFPKGTSPDIVRKLNDAMLEAGKEPSVRARLEQFGTLMTTKPDVFQAHIKAETALLAEVIRKSNIKAE